MPDLSDNTYYRYPYCWFGNFIGCQDEPAVPGSPIVGDDSEVPTPLRLEISLGNFHYDLNFENILYVTVAACTGLLTAAIFTFIVRNEFCMRAFKAAVASIGTSMSFVRFTKEDFANNNVPGSGPEETTTRQASSRSHLDTLYRRQSTLNEPETRVKKKRRNSSRSQSRVSVAPSRIAEKSLQVHTPSPPAAGVTTGFHISTRIPNREESVKVIHRASEATPSMAASWTRSVVSPRKNCILELHQNPRGKSVPCENPWGMRLECLLRTLKIPYTAICDCSPTQPPWFIYRDFEKSFQSTSKPTEGSYSSVVESLCNYFPESRVNLLNQKKEVPAHFLTSLVEYHLIPTLNKALELSKIPTLNNNQNQTGSSVRDQLDGIRGNDGVELKKALLDDLVSLSAALSGKAYFLGDRISEVDCTIFAALAPIVWTDSGLVLQQLVYRHSNLVNFCLRMKSELWPDWNDNIEPSSSDSPRQLSPTYFTQPESDA